jgi:3-isopropylmalate/(R)-2-methylmalate dehydratase small subunit
MSKVSLIDGRALPLRGNDIDTDRIIPARFLVTVTFEGLEQHVFEDDRRSAQHPFDDPRYQGASGESFAEIFFGNSAMIGMPCVTAAPTDVQAIMERVERNPAARVHIDLAAGSCEVDGFRCAVSMPPKTREAFLSGAWDTTGMLLDRFEEVEATAAKLPYVGGF